MNPSTATILVVDDDPLNLLLISEYLEGSYRLITACDGADAWERLQASPREFDVVLLDLMMPRMGGLQVLQRIKSHPQLQVLPVILQTARASPEEIHEGIRAGAYYYLTKPLEKAMLCSVIATAVQDHLRYRCMQSEIDRTGRVFGLMSRGEFHFRTLDEGRGLARLLANACPNPRKAVVGISELLVNAVEHGNLGIGYQEKGQLLETGRLTAEVEARLARPEYRDLRVDVTYARTSKEIRIHIRDQGTGFDWEHYFNLDPNRIFDAHGRGIAVARIMSFDRLEYGVNGNEVLGVIRLQGTPSGHTTP